MYLLNAYFNKFIIPKKELAGGNYRVGLLIFNIPRGFKFNREEEFRVFQYTNEKLKIPKPIEIDELPEESGNIQYYLQVKLENQSIIIDNGWAFIENQDAKDCQKHLVLKSKNKIYTLNTKLVKRYELIKIFNSPKYLYAGFRVKMLQQYFENDTYKIGILFIKDSKIIGFKWTEKEVVLGQ